MASVACISLLFPVSATKADARNDGEQMQPKKPKYYCSTTITNCTCEKVSKATDVPAWKARGDSERVNKSLVEKSSTPNAHNCEHRCRSRVRSALSMNLSPAYCQQPVRQKCMSQMEISRPQDKHQKREDCVSSSSCWLCSHTHRHYHHHQLQHQDQQHQPHSEAVSMREDKAMVSPKAAPTSNEGDTRKKTLTITLLPTVDSRGEGKKKGTASGVANEASKIGDVCQKLKKCVASVQNRILDSLLVGNTSTVGMYAEKLEMLRLPFFLSTA